MKLLSKIMFGLIATLFITTSCGKDEDLNQNENTELPTNDKEAFEMITKKWVFIETGDIKSLELTKDTMYIVELPSTITSKKLSDESEYKTGKFEISSNGKEINLIDFGKIELKSLTDSVVKLDITFYNTNNTLSLSGGISKFDLKNTAWNFELIHNESFSWKANVIFYSDGTSYYDEPDSQCSYKTYGTWYINNDSLYWDLMASDSTNTSYQFVGKVDNRNMEGTYSFGDDTKQWNAERYPNMIDECQPRIGISGKYEGDYSWDCGREEYSGSSSIILDIVDDNGSLSGMAYYLNDSSSFTGNRVKSWEMNEFGPDSVIYDKDGDKLIIYIKEASNFVHNGFYGTISESTISGQTLNGDSADGCSNGTGLSGIFSITKN